MYASIGVVLVKFSETWYSEELVFNFDLNLILQLRFPRSSLSAFQIMIKSCCNLQKVEQF